MKKTTVVVAIALIFSSLTFAQREGHRGERRGYHQDLSVEQVATLQTKKMTLALDLSAKQQKQLMDYNLEQVAYRKAKMEERKTRRATNDEKPSAEERYALENERLDHMIAQQSELKKILSEEQFSQWKKIQMHKHAKHQNRRQRTGRK